MLSFLGKFLISPERNFAVFCPGLTDGGTTCVRIRRAVRWLREHLDRGTKLAETGAGGGEQYPLPG